MNRGAVARFSFYLRLCFLLAGTILVIVQCGGGTTVVHPADPSTEFGPALPSRPGWR